MEDKITLDRESFRTLASKTRVDILKSLGRRRKMLAELSKQFGMSPSTIKEHMDNLARADLVIQIDDGHKWKYYELTQKGSEIVNPTGSRIYVILGLSLFALVFTSWDLIRTAFRSATPMIAGRGGEFSDAAKDAIVEQAPSAAGDVANEIANETIHEAAAAVAVTTPLMPFAHILGIAVFTAIFGISLGYLIAKKMGTPSFLE